MKAFILILLLMPTSLMADSIVTFMWQRPTQNTDDSLLAVSDINSFNIYCNNELTFSPAGDVESYEAVLASGEYSCYMTTVTGRESLPSLTVDFIVDEVSDPSIAAKAIVKFKAVKE